MEYRIALDRMEFRALHGCYELERKVGNRFTVDLELTALLGEAAAEDDVEKTVNYLTVYQIVRERMGQTQRSSACCMSFTVSTPNAIGMFHWICSCVMPCVTP